jgi:hypothetical protein
MEAQAMASQSSSTDKIFSFFNSLTPAIVGLVGVMVGAGLQHCSTQEVEEQSRFLEQRLEAYGDFFESVAIEYEINAEEDRPTPDHDKISKLQGEFLRIHYDARFRVAIFGTSPVVKRLANFYKQYRKRGPCPKGPREQWLADTAIYYNMRQEIYKHNDDQEVSIEDLNVLLWNCTVPIETQNEK